MFHLYSNPRSTYSQRVLLYLKYREIPVEIIPVALEKLENRKRPFLQINPYGKVPVLKDGDFLLSESQAIIQYLEDIGNYENSLFPKDPKLNAKLSQMRNQAETEFCFPGSIIYFAKKFKPKESWDLNRMKESSKRIGRHFEILENVLTDQEYLFLNKFGLLEILYAPFIFNISYMDTKLPPKVEEWINRVLNTNFVREVLGTNEG